MPRLKVAFFQRIFAHYQAGLVKELNQRSKHDYHFFGSAHDPMCSGIVPLTPELRKRLPFTLCNTFQLGKYFAWQWRAIREALSGPFDVYIFEGNYSHLSTWLAVVLCKFRRKGVFLYSHGWIKREEGILPYLRCFFYGLADGLILYHENARQIGIEKGFSPAMMYVAHNCLDEEEIQKHQKNLNAAKCDSFRREWFRETSERPLLVSVGRLVAKKEFSLLLDAVMQIQKKGLLVNIMIVGDGPERSALENKAAAYGVNLALPGACYGEEFLSLCFGSAAVAVIPGAAGLLVIHSMSYGTSVIVHDDDYHQKPEASAVEDCLTGNKFKRGNVNSLAAAITNVLSGSPSSEKVTAACRKIIESYWSPRFMRSVFDKAVDALPAVSVKESHIRSN